MAKPPEPLHEIIPLATLVVEATVKEVTATGPTPPPPDKPATWSDKGTLNPSQELVLDVARVLRGTLDGATVTARKPEAGYMVKVGVKGAWLIDADGVVLGRYGPDTWTLDKVEAACK